jgi:hypothetical protein
MGAPMQLSILSETVPPRRISIGGILTLLIFSPLLIPVGLLMLCVCAFSIMWGWVLIARGKYLDHRLRAAMRSAGRYLSWEEFAHRLNAGEGTLIRDFTISGWPGGYSRLWWTPDDVYSLCPFSWVDLQNEQELPEFWDAPDWCRKRYTAPKGTALLIAATTAQCKTLFEYERGKLFRDTPLHGMKWVDLCMVRIGRRRPETIT